MNARQILAATLLSLPGFVDLGGDGWMIRPSRRERQLQQTPEQRDAAKARAEAKRARRRARNLRGAA